MGGPVGIGWWPSPAEAIASWNRRALSAQPSQGDQRDSDEDAYVIERLSGLLAEIAVIVNGPQPPGTRWSYHDLPEKVRALAARQPVGQEPVAHVPIHPRNGPLWADTYPEGSAADGRSPHYERMPLYAATPAQKPAQVYLDGLDRALGEAIDQRDRYHEVADDLAGHIAAITGVDIGEHSSANCPWQNAIEAAEEYKPAQAGDLGRWSQRHAEDLKQAIHTALSAHAGSLSQKKRDAISDYVKRLLIDSQAVVNG